MKVKTQPVIRGRLARTMISLAPFSSVKKKHVDMPLAAHLGENRRGKMAAWEYANIALVIGSMAPYRAAKQITRFIENKAKVPKKKDGISLRKKEALEKTTRSLRSFGRIMLPAKLTVYGCLSYLAYSFLRIGVALFAFSSSGEMPYVQSAPPDDLPVPLEVSVANESYTLYGGNGWNQELRQVCATHFTRDNYLSERSLTQCLWEEQGVSLAESQLPQILAGLRSSTIVITPSMLEDHDAILEALLEAEDIALQTESTAKKDDSMDFIAGEKGRVSYTGMYRRVFVPADADSSKIWLPSILQEADIFMSPNVFNEAYTLPAEITPIAYRLVVTGDSGDPAVTYIPLDVNDSIYFFETDDFGDAMAVEQHFSGDIGIAASIMREHHQELTYAQLKMLLQSKLMTQLVMMRHEDPWQDIAACRWADCSYADQFAKEFSDVEYGVPIGNGLYKPSWWLASKLHTPMREQGYGPYQVILGLFEEAGQNEEVMLHFAEYLTDEDFVDEAAMLRAIFEKPTMSAALVYDFILTRLKDTVFENPEVRMSPIFTPFLKNPRVARQYALMATANILVAHPERDSDAKIMVMLASQHFSLWSFYSDVLDTGDLFSRVVYKRTRMSTVQGEDIVTYFSGTNEIDRYLYPAVE